MKTFSEALNELGGHITWDRTYDDYIVLYSTHPYAGRVDNHNFLTLAEMFPTTEVNTKHWACGYICWLLIDPGDLNDDLMDNLEDVFESLKTYPILDEDRFYEELAASTLEYWEELDQDERREILRECGSDCRYTKNGIEFTEVFEYLESRVFEQALI